MRDPRGEVVSDVAGREPSPPLALPGVESREATASQESMASNVSKPEAKKLHRRVTVDCKKLQMERDAKKAKPTKPVSYRRFEEFLAVERGLRESCATLPFTLILWVTFTVLTWLHSYVETSFETRSALYEAVKEVEVSADTNQTVRRLRFGNIATHEELWRWMEHGLMPLLSGEDTMSSGAKGQQHIPGFVRLYNRVVGSVRLQQKRSISQACSVDQKLQDFYNQDCHPVNELSTESFGPEPVAGGTRDPCFVAGSLLTASGVDPKAFFAWLDIERPLQSLQMRVRMLQDLEWLDAASNELIIQMLLFNAEVKIYTRVRLDFVFQRGGWITQNLDVRPVKSNTYPNVSYAIPDAIWILLVLFLFWQETKQLLRDKEEGTLREYWMDLWNTLDWLSIILGMAIGIYFFFVVGSIESITNSVEAMGEPPAMAAYEAARASGNKWALLTQENLEFQNKVAEILESFEYLVAHMSFHRLCMFWYTIVIMLRFFKGFRGQPRIAVISETLMEASVDLVHFLIIFIVVFFNFALGGYVLFGAQLAEWSTLGMSINSCFSVMFGEVDYQAFHRVAPMTAAIWFWSYVIVMILIMLNLLIAIIMEHYMSVKERVGESGQSIFEQAGQLLSDLRWRFSYEGSRKSVPISDLLALISSDPSVHRGGGGLNKAKKPQTEEERANRIRDETHFVSVKFLTEHGCDEQTARRLLERCARMEEAMMDANPTERLQKIVERDVYNLKMRFHRMEENLQRFMVGTFQDVDRIALKQSKLTTLARRIIGANELPPGWRQLEDDDGRKYYYNDITGLSSWTLPKPGDQQQAQVRQVQNLAIAGVEPEPVGGRRSVAT